MHPWLVVLLGVAIVVVYFVIAGATRATSRERLGALLGGAVAALVNMATDAAAHALGFWRYTEVTTGFGPIVYYLEAGLGCSALALLVRWLGRRHGVLAQLKFFAAVTVYAPIRDWAMAKTTGLMEFHYDPWIVVVIADALSEFVIPILVAYMGVVLVAPRHPDDASRV